MKLHSFGKIFSLVAMLALMFALTFAVSVTANAQEAEPTVAAQSGDELVITTPDLAEPMCGKVKFQWNLVDGATTYRVYINGKHTINMAIDPESNETPDVLYYIISDLTIGEECNFTVDAVGNGQIIASGTNLYTPEHVWNESLYTVTEPSCWEDGKIEWFCILEHSDGKDYVAKEEILPLVHEGLTHVEALAPSCHQNGNIEYWYCTECMQVWTDESLEARYLTNIRNVVIPYDVDNVVHVEKVEGGCHWNGMNEYWYCTECDAVFADAALRQLTNRKNLVIPMTDSLVHKEARDPSCHQDGNIEHWYCTGDCAGVWTNEELTELTNHKNVIIPHNVDNDGYVAKVEPGCHQNGMNEYWYCKECDAVFADAALTQLTNRKNLVIAYDSEHVVYVAKVEAGCHQNGSEAYWYCTECDAVFTDAALTQLTNRKNLVIPYDNEHIIKVDAVDPTCHQNGNVEFWYCSECDAVFTDVALTQLSNRRNVVIPCTAEIGHEEAIAVDCHENGRREFWYCTECDAVFTDALRTELSNRKAVIIPYNADNIVHVKAVSVECHQNGNIEHWYCNQCYAIFSDINLENEVDEAIIRYNAENVVKVEKVEPGCHQNGMNEYWYCTECDAVFADRDLELLTNRKNLTIPYTAEIGHEDAIAAQCHINGRQEFWYCMDCSAIFTDIALTQLSNIKAVVVPYSVDNVYHAQAADPSCHQNGNIEYWHCLVCDDVYIDPTLTTPSTIARVTIPYDRSNIAHENAIAAGCHATGMMEYWYCTKCDAVFTDTDLTKLSNRKSIITPCTAEIIHTAKLDPTCTKNGNIEYWECAQCAAVFSDATLKTPTDNTVIPAKGHKLQNATCTKEEKCSVCGFISGAALGHTEVEIPGVDATCTESGLTAGKKCTVCNTVTVEQKTIDALGHEYAYETDINKVIIYDVCTRCGERNPENDTPKIQFTDMLVKTIAISVCALVILIALKALFSPASTTPWYRRRR